MRGAEEAFQGSRRFDVRGRLGDGGGGVVYRAFDHQLGREVALKLLRDSEGDGFARLRSGFSSLRHLKHPNLVQLYDLVEENGSALLVMELVDGVGLLEYLRRRDRLFDELRLRSCFAQLAQALRALHLDRKVHRDVKPSNIRVTQHGRVVLLDLDFALDLDRGQPTSESDTQLRPVGTALYMAPEQAAARELKPTSDWYALGVVLYEALTGVVPHRGSDLEVMLAKQDGQVVPPRALAPDVPADLNDLCVALLAPNPVERPSGSQVLRQLGVPDGVVTGRFSLASLVARRAFVGRRVELARLDAALEHSRHGPVVFRVTGEAGIGKTALCAEFVRRLDEAGKRALVLRSYCPRYPDRAHAPLHEPVSRLVEALRQRGAALRVPLGAGELQLLERMFPGSMAGLEGDPGLPSVVPPDPLERRWRAIDGLRSLLREVARDRPLVWWLDDYHWADADTQRLISAVVRSEGAPRVLLLLSEEPEPGLEQRSEPAADASLALSELDAQESLALTERAMEHGAFANRVAQQVPSRGLPLLIQERLQYLSSFGEAPDPRASLPQLLLRRVEALPAPARHLLEVVCAGHDPLPPEVCERAAELSRTEFSRQLSRLEASGFLRRVTQAGKDMLVAEHPFIADCVDLDLRGEQRVLVHQKLAAALVERDPIRASGRLLRHQGESGDHAAAAQSARVAAEQAHDALAFQRAAELFTLCASLDPPPRDEDGHRRLRRMAEALGNAGWSLQAATIYRDAAVGANAADALHMRQRAVEHLLRGAEIPEGLDAVRELLGSIDVKLPKSTTAALWSIAGRRTLLRLRGFNFEEHTEGQVSASELRRVDVLWSSGVQLSLVDVVRGAHFLTRALTEALKLGEPERVVRALCTEAWTRALEPNGLPRARSLLQAASALHARYPSHALHGYQELAQGVVAFAEYRFEDCERHCRYAELTFRKHCGDAIWESTAAQTFQLIAVAQLARFGDQGEKLERVLLECKERGDVWGSCYSRSIGAMGVMLAHDQPLEAAAAVRDAEARWAASSEFHLQHLFALLAAVYIRLYSGQHGALEMLDSRWGDLKRMLMLRLPFASTSLHELRARTRIVAARAQGDTTALLGAEADAKFLLRGTPAAMGFGHLIRANVAQVRGRPADAVDELRKGLSLLDRQGPRVWMLSARIALGELIGGEEGSALCREAEGELIGHGVRDLPRWQAMMMPGFSES